MAPVFEQGVAELVPEVLAWESQAAWLDYIASRQENFIFKDCFLGLGI
jgi:hypothetical protein